MGSEEPYKRRAPGRIRKNVTVRGHYRSLPKPQKGVKKYEPNYKVRKKGDEKVE